jgi:putative ABC transport system substrate-binding protein
MTRRGVAAVIALVLASITIDAAAQSPGKVYRVGFLTIGAASVPVVSATLDGLVRGLERHGYSVGTNLLIESRFADGNADRLPGLVKELLGSGVDVIVTLSYPAARAVKEGTTTVPIVVAGASDPVETGLVASLSRPGGITGISDMAAELSAKRLELLKTAVPSLNRVAILFNAKDAGMTARYRKASAAAATMGITVQSLGVREPDDFDGHFPR